MKHIETLCACAVHDAAAPVAARGYSAPILPEPAAIEWNDLAPSAGL
jgi:hypothetical protein